MASEGFIAFYTSPRFWAGDSPDPGVAAKYSVRSAKVFEYLKESFSLLVCKDGMLILRIHELEADPAAAIGSGVTGSEKVRWWGRYLDYANALYLLLDAASAEVQGFLFLDQSEITNRDALRVTVEDGKPSSFGGGRFSLFRRAAGFQDPEDALHELAGLHAIPEAVFVRLSETFGVAISNGLIPSLSAVAKGLCEFKIGNYSTALVLAWFVIESVLNKRWKSFLDGKNATFPDGSKRIDRDRFKTLTGRDYPVSVVSSVLELSEVIDYQTFSRIDKVRRSRNSVAHQEEGFECTNQHAAEALHLALSLLLTGTPIRPALNLSFSVHG